MKTYTVVISEKQRKLIHDALYEYELSYIVASDAAKLRKRLEGIPQSETAHPGIKHVLVQ